MPKLRPNVKLIAGFLPRKGRDQDYGWLGAPPGFGVKVSVRGEAGKVSRSYVIAYRFRGTKRFDTLGAVEALDLADAKDAAKAVLTKVAADEDPRAEKREPAREPLTVAALVGKFIEAGEATKAPKTTREYRVMLRGEIEGEDFGKALAGNVRRPDVKAFLEAIARRAPVVSNRTYQLVRAAFGWGVSEELLDRNPCEGLKRPRKEKGRDRVLSEDELRVLLTALDAKRRKVRLVPEVVSAAVRVLVLCGTRRTETFRARWEDIDFARNEWSIPGDARKGGEPLTVPLSPAARAAFKTMEGNESEWCFAGERGASIAANPGRIGATLKSAVEKTAAKLKTPVAPWTLHDLRRTAATGCAELGAPPHVVALILGHQGLPGAGRVTGVYDRSRRVREVAPWLTAWGEHVARVEAGKTTPGTVTAFGGRKTAT